MAKISAHEVENIRDQAFVLFRGKCIKCRRPAVCMHEIVPRSKDPNWCKIEKVVILCHKCHLWAHERGASSSDQELQELRFRYSVSVYIPDILGFFRGNCISNCRYILLLAAY